MRQQKTNAIDLSVVILSFNTAVLTRACLASVFASSLRGYSLEVIVCDNGSTDGSISLIRKEFPKVICIENKRNLGFAGGNNPGILRAKGRYVLLLNSDTEVQKETFAVMLSYMDAHAEVGAATCRLVLADGSIDPACHRGFPTIWAACSYFLKLEKLFPSSRAFGQYHLGYLDMKTIHEVDIISGAFFMIQKKVIDEVGLLDESFFFYGEDMDWCYRIKEKGYKILYNPSTKILHRKKQSGRSHADRERRVRTEILFFKYNKLFYQKHYLHQYPFLIIHALFLLFDVRIWLLSKFGI